jgi:hypothetical protein
VTTPRLAPLYKLDGSGRIMRKDWSHATRPTMVTRRQIVALIRLVLTVGYDGLRLARMEKRGCLELDETRIVAAFLADME